MKITTIIILLSYRTYICLYFNWKPYLTCVHFLLSSLLLSALSLMLPAFLALKYTDFHFRMFNIKNESRNPFLLTLLECFFHHPDILRHFIEVIFIISISIGPRTFIWNTSWTLSHFFFWHLLKQQKFFCFLT